MKKLISFFILLSVLCCSSVASSQSVEETDPGFVILDILLYRPAGLVATVIGTGVFIGLSPLTAFASIPEPHDAFAKTAKILIFAPGAYTFIRPVGDRDFPYHASAYPYHASAYNNKPLATSNSVEIYKSTAIPKQRPVTPVIPDAQPPQQQSYPEAGKGL